MKYNVESLNLNNIFVVQHFRRSSKFAGSLIVCTNLTDLTNILDVLILVKIYSKASKCWNINMR